MRERQLLSIGDKLLAEVNRVYPLLASSNKRVTQKQIADAIGTTLSKLWSLKKVRKRLTEISALYIWSEEKLLAEINRVYPLLAASSERVTQKQIADEIGVPLSLFGRHRKVSERLTEIW